MICPDCLDKVLALLPTAVGKLAGLIPTIGPIAGPLAEELAKALMKELQSKPPADITRAEFPDSGAVSDRLEAEWGKPVSGR